MAMPREATRKRRTGGKSGVDRHMPIIAVKTIRLLTLGLQRWLKAANRWPMLSGWATIVCMTVLLAVPGKFEQAFNVGTYALGAGAVGEGHDQLPLRIGKEHRIVGFSGGLGRRRS